jgi:hypothetical protein
LKKLAFLFALLLVGVASAAPSIVSTTQTAATVEGLDCGSKYRFEIQRYAENGELSSTANSVDAQTEGCPDTQPPSAPQDLPANGQAEPSIAVSGSTSIHPVGVAPCIVPNVRKRTVKRARAMLSARRCALGRITRAYSPRVGKGRIVRQSPRPGARLPRSTRVNVAVSRSRRR